MRSLHHGQRFRHGRNALVDRHVALEHGRKHGRCQRGEDVGLDAAAETVGEDDRRVIVVPFERTLIAAERLPVFVAADDADVPDRVPAAIRSLRIIIAVLIKHDGFLQVVDRHLGFRRRLAEQTRDLVDDAQLIGDDVVRPDRPRGSSFSGSCCGAGALSSHRA